MSDRPVVKSLRDLAKEALEIQNACNLCGVAIAFARVMQDLAAHTNGTDARNEHPVAILWADKIANLTGTQSLGHETVMQAYQWAWRLLDEQPMPGGG